MERAQPRWKKDDALRRAEAADGLLDKHIDVLGSRLEVGTSEQLKADIVTFRRIKGSGALGGQKTATATERELAKDGHDLVMAFREAVKRSRKASDALRTAMGVGETLDPSVTQDVLDALEAVATNATELRKCGPTEEDIAEAARIATDLAAADQAQAGSKRARSSTTEDRIDVQLRIEATVDAVWVAARFAFRKQPATLKRFERLIASGTYKADDDEDGGDPGGPAA